jgi:hypothetical protein
MNILHPNHAAQIIAFPVPQRALNRIRVKRLARVREVETVPLTETCKNAPSCSTYMGSSKGEIQKSEIIQLFQ